MNRAGAGGWWNQLKRKLTRFFRAYNSSNIWYSIIREFCVRKFAEAGWKICKIDQCGPACRFFFHWGRHMLHVYLEGLNLVGGNCAVGWTPLMQMEFLKYCIIRTGDSARYYLPVLFFFFNLEFGINFYRGLFMGSRKCKFVFPLTARWAAG